MKPLLFRFILPILLLSFSLQAEPSMELVNHSSDEVHKIYSRLNITDAAASLSRVPPPPDPF
jgi:hypothetical protein